MRLLFCCVLHRAAGRSEIRWGNINVVSIVCSPGWDRVNGSFKNWRGTWSPWPPWVQQPCCSHWIWCRLFSSISYALYITIYLVLYNIRFVAQSTSPTQCLTKTYFCHPSSKEFAAAVWQHFASIFHPFFSEKISSEELHSLTICLHFNYYETNKSWQHSRYACKSQGFLVLQYVQLSSRQAGLLWQHDIQSLKVYGM